MQKKLRIILFGAVSAVLLSLLALSTPEAFMPQDPAPAPAVEPEPLPEPEPETLSAPEPEASAVSEPEEAFPPAPAAYSFDDPWAASAAPPSGAWRGITAAVTEPDSLPPELKGLLVFPDISSYDDKEMLVLYDGRVIAHGHATAVTNLATGEAVGFTMESYISDTDNYEELYQYSEHSQLKYELYHADGSFWYDTGELYVTNVLGDYFFGDAPSKKYPCLTTYCTTDPSDPDSLKEAPRTYPCGNDRCVLEVYQPTMQFSGSGIYVVDSQMNVLDQYTPSPSYLCLYSFPRPDGEQDVFLSWQDTTDAMINLRTGTVYPYLSGNIIEGGYRVFRTLDDRYDLWDADGTILLRNCENEVVAYNDHFRVERGENYTVFANGKPILTFPYDMMYDNFVYVYGSNFFVYQPATKTFKRYGPNGEDLGTEDLVQLWGCCEINYECYFGDTLCPPERSDYLYCHYLYDSTDLHMNVKRFVGARTNEFKDLLDENGKVIRSGFSEIKATDYPGVYSARRGLLQGLIDKNGDWLWSEYVFSENDDAVYYRGIRGEG